MPYKEKKIEKLFYSIGEVANLINVNVSVIRFWDKEFEVLKPKKNKKGNRLFTKSDLENVKLIHYLLKIKGYTVKGAKKAIKSNKNHIKENLILKDKLNEIRDFLTSIKQSL